MNADQKSNAPEGTTTITMNGLKEYEFAISVSPADCQGCASCVNVCPGKKGQKALVMQTQESQLEAQKLFDYGVGFEVDEAVTNKFKETTVKGSQFKKPLLEFSGACAGCGETPYAKLTTQLFGDRMYIANATGCSSIWEHQRHQLHTQ